MTWLKITFDWWLPSERAATFPEGMTEPSLLQSTSSLASPPSNASFSNSSSESTRITSSASSVGGFWEIFDEILPTAILVARFRFAFFGEILRRFDVASSSLCFFDVNRSVVDAFLTIRDDSCSTTFVEVWSILRFFVDFWSCRSFFERFRDSVWSEILLLVPLLTLVPFALLSSPDASSWFWKVWKYIE